MKRAALSIGCGFVVGCALAIAKPPGPGNPTPGWNFGRINCNQYSSPSVKTWEECMACCDRAAGISGDGNDVLDCKVYCDWIHGRGAVVTN